MLKPDEIRNAEERLVTILRNHQLGWIVRRVDDALVEGHEPDHGQFESLNLRRLVLLVEATQRALQMTSALEENVPDLLLAGTDGTRVHIQPDSEGGDIDARLRAPILIDRAPSSRRPREEARNRTHEHLTQLLHEALESR